MGRKWVPGQKEKFQATMRKKLAEKKKEISKPKSNGAATNVRDAIGFLRDAKRYVHKQIRDGHLKEMDNAHLFAELALRILEGKDV